MLIECVFILLQWKCCKSVSVPLKSALSTVWVLFLFFFFFSIFFTFYLFAFVASALANQEFSLQGFFGAVFYSLVCTRPEKRKCIKCNSCLCRVPAVRPATQHHVHLVPATVCFTEGTKKYRLWITQRLTLAPLITLISFLYSLIILAAPSKSPC